MTDLGGFTALSRTEIVLFLPGKGIRHHAIPEKCRNEYRLRLFVVSNVCAVELLFSRVQHFRSFSVRSNKKYLASPTGNNVFILSSLDNSVGASGCFAESGQLHIRGKLIIHSGSCVRHVQAILQGQQTIDTLQIGALEIK